jgi:hypothetical protein
MENAMEKLDLLVTMELIILLILKTAKKMENKIFIMATEINMGNLILKMGKDKEKE